MSMPDMTGIQLTKELIMIRPNIPVILVSGHGDRINIDVTKEKGIMDYAYKPLMKADLIKKVRHILDVAKNRSQ